MQERVWEVHQSSKQDSAFVTVFPPFSAKFWPTLRDRLRFISVDTDDPTFVLASIRWGEASKNIREPDSPEEKILVSQRQGEPKSLHPA